MILKFFVILFLLELCVTGYFLFEKTERFWGLRCSDVLKEEERGGKWRHLQADIILYMHNKMYVKVTVGKIFIESVER